jgi:hypothetical protein
LVEPAWLLKVTQGLRHVDEGRAAMCASAPLISGTSCFLVAGKAARDEGGAELQRQRHEVDRRIELLTTPRLLFEPLSAVAENWPLVRP